jgi:hypothetical protein
MSHVFVLGSKDELQPESTIGTTVYTAINPSSGKQVAARMSIPRVCTIRSFELINLHRQPRQTCCPQLIINQ